MKKFSSITRVNSRRTSQNKKILRILILGVLLLALVVFLPRLFSAAASVVVYPVSSVKTWFVESSDSFPQYFRDRSKLVHEIQELKSEISGGGGDLRTVNRLIEENDSLRSLLGYEGEERIMAGVIGRPGLLPYDVLVLDRGTKDGVLEGAPVFISNNSIIGIVKKSLPKSSVVEMVTSPGFKATVYVLGPDIYTTAQGIGGGQLRVGVPQGILLSEGDLVVLPSVHKGIYGEVSVVQSEVTRPEQYGYVSPEISLASIRLVSVGTTPLSPVSFDEAQIILKDIRTTVFEIPVPDEILVDIGTSSASTTIDEENRSPTSTEDSL